MLEYLIKIGRRKAVILLTITAWFPAVLLTMLFTTILDKFGVDTNPRIGVIIASAVELILAPTITYYFMGQSIRIYQLEKTMRDFATNDSLTGLLVRRVFLDQLELLFNLSKRGEDPLTLIMIDIDYLKRINDHQGHLAGDKVLVSFSQVVRNEMRCSDIACRYGGDEFIILLPSTSINNAKIFANRLNTAILESRRNIGEIYDYSVSIGLATYPCPSINSEIELIAAADKALYISKEQRQDIIHSFN